MIKKKHYPLLFFANVIIFAAVIFCDTSQIIDLSIKTASPMILIPLLCSFAFFSDLKRCVIAGLIAGAFVDSISYKSYCFNTILLMLIAVAVCLAANNLFNKNIRAALVVTFAASAIYFLLLWLFFYCIGSDIQSSLGYLLKYALPSTVYSTVFIFPFYYMYKRFKKIKEQP